MHIFYQVSGGWDNTVKVWDIRSKTPVHSIFGPHVCGESIDINEKNQAPTRTQAHAHACTHMPKTTPHAYRYWLDRTDPATLCRSSDVGVSFLFRILDDASMHTIMDPMFTYLTLAQNVGLLYGKGGVDLLNSMEYDRCQGRIGRVWLSNIRCAVLTFAGPNRSWRKSQGCSSSYLLSRTHIDTYMHTPNTSRLCVGANSMLLIFLFFQNLVPIYD